MNPPTIAPLSADARTMRPFWSVMIPAYNPDPDYLAQTLRSVLTQAPGSEQMQIEVVDDCSPGIDVAAMVRSIAGERVKVSQTTKNLGLAGCWNTCIERSRGEWVHILHQDDWVLPEFYARFEALINAAPDIDAAFTRNLNADADGHWTSIGPLIDPLMRSAGEFKNFNVYVAAWVPMQCAAAVVKRSTYERLGGYRNDIPYVLDWEMWCRIAANGRWGYVPQTGAVYRQHDKSQTTRLHKAGKMHQDLLDGGRIARAHFSSEVQAQTEAVFRHEFVSNVFRDAVQLYLQGNPRDAGKLLGSFHGEAMKSNRRLEWIWLRMRAKIKPVRQWFTRI
jgi:GT2 family glycosyltransferase